MKDYLYHAYGVESLHVRSVVRLSPIEENKPSELRVRGRRWHRPASKKYMTIRMEKPFVWPEEPLDYKPWDRESYEAANDQRREEEEAMTPKGNSMEPSDAKWLKEKAAKLRNERKEKAARQLAELQQRQRQEAERRVQRQAAEKMERQAAREAARLERSEAKRQSSE